MTGSKKSLSKSKMSFNGAFRFVQLVRKTLENLNIVLHIVYCENIQYCDFCDIINYYLWPIFVLLQNCSANVNHNRNMN